MIDEDDREPHSRIEEGVDRVLLLPLFVVFDVALPWSAWLAMDWRVVLFVAGVILLRRLPLVLAMRQPLRTAAPKPYGSAGSVPSASLPCSTSPTPTNGV